MLGKSAQEPREKSMDSRATLRDSQPVSPAPPPPQWEALDSALGSLCASASLSLRCGYYYVSHRLLCGLNESMHHNYHGPHCAALSTNLWDDLPLRK